MYDSAVVIASSEEEAKTFHPDDEACWDHEEGKWTTGYFSSNDTWGTIDQITVELIGTALPGSPSGVVVSSFNAG